MCLFVVLHFRVLFNVLVLFIFVCFRLLPFVVSDLCVLLLVRDVRVYLFICCCVCVVVIVRL